MEEGKQPGAIPAVCVSSKGIYFQATAGAYATVLTSEPLDKLCRKLFRAVWAELILPELSAVPIASSKLENDVSLDDALAVELASVLLDELSPEIKPVRFSRAACAPATSPELMALNRFTTSCATSLNTALVDEVESALGGGGLGGCSLCSVVSADCAAEMSPSANAVETLARNCPIGLFESALAGVSCSTCARYFCASVVSPDWIAEMRLASAASKGFLLVEADVEETDDEVSSVIKELLWIPDIDMSSSFWPGVLQDGASKRTHDLKLIALKVLAEWVDAGCHLGDYTELRYLMRQTQIGPSFTNQSIGSNAGNASRQRINCSHRDVWLA
jgi:hypothetical protein